MSISTPVITVDDVVVSYGAAPVVDRARFVVNAGQCFGLIGLNGAGKTTLMKAILGLRAYQAGEITVFNAPASSQGAKVRMAYLPERFEPPWFLTGLEFLRFSFNLYKQEFDQEEVFELSERLSLSRAALRNRVDTYSKGMRQKLGLLSTILTGCDLLVLDEPMSGLDPLSRHLVKEMLLAMKAENRTIFLCSHILADMDELCDDVAVLHDSKIKFTGSPLEMKGGQAGQSLEEAFLSFVKSSS